MASTPTYNRNTEAEDILLNGDRIVATAGTAVILSEGIAPLTKIKCYEVTIQAKSNNIGNVYVGGPNVPNTQAGGLFLSPGQSITLTPHYLNQIYLNADTNGNGVTYIYWTAL